MLNVTIATQQQDVKHFLHTVSEENINDIIRSEYVVLDLETTGLTLFAKPTAVGKSAKIGPDLTFTAYQRAYGGKVNCSLRMRILAIQLSDSQKLAFDLDSLDSGQKQRLFDTVIDDKVVIGHNLTFDFSWLSHYTNKKPALVLDTMLIARSIMPSLSWNVYAKGHADEEDAQAVALKMTDGACSLEALSVSIGLPRPSKEWQHPRNWCVSNLSEGHYDYVISDVDAPLHILNYIAGSDGTDFADTLTKLWQADALTGSTYKLIYAKVPVVLAQMHHFGMPLKEEVAEAVSQDRADRIPSLVQEVIAHIPAAEEYMSSLASLSTSLPAGLKAVLGDYLSSNGFDVSGDDGKPVLNSKVVKMSGANLSGWDAWTKLQRAKKELQFSSEFLVIAGPAEEAGFKRLHPLISASTVTGRTNSQLPNSQNLPRPDNSIADELQIRSCITARPGYQIVSADYSQIELRIAAALAVRAYNETLEAVKTGIGVPKWALEALRLGDSCEDICVSKTIAKDRSFDDYKKSVALAWRAAKAKGPVMADIFRLGVDPHLATGLSMAVMQGVMPPVGDPIQYLAKLSKEELGRIKVMIKDQRQSAKALNFGLLYGMGSTKLHCMGVTDYNLSWSLQEAEAAKDGWFEMFSDIAWWQIWDGISKRASTQEALACYRRDKYTKEIEKSDIRLYVNHTLMGRPVVVSEKRECLNYADQGTGADIALMALVTMQPAFQKHVFNLVHDELMLEVPDYLVEAAKIEVQRCMLAAADSMLSNYNIPAEAEPSSAHFWRKD